MQDSKPKLTEERRQILFRQLNHGIGIASYADGTYASIHIIESALVELWESGVTDTEIQRCIKNRNFPKCHEAITLAQGAYKQRDECGINSKDAERLKMLLPKRHKEIFDQKNIMKACSLSAVSRVEYNEDFNRISFVKIKFNKYQWESAIKLTNLLNKIEIIHEKFFNNYETSITIWENGMPVFIDLLTKNSDLITSESEEKKPVKRENIETIGLKKSNSRFSGLFSEKRPDGITIKAIENKFGKKIADAIEEVDLFNYFCGFINITFYKSNSDEINQFCRIMKTNAIAYDKSGPEKRTVFIESKEACKELENLLLSSEPSITSEKRAIASYLTKENISIAFDLNLENISSINETKDNEIEIFFEQKEKISTITNLESTLASEGISTLYSKVKSVLALSQVHCIKINSDDNPKLVQLVQKKCQEKLASLSGLLHEN